MRPFIVAMAAAGALGALGAGTPLRASELAFAPVLCGHDEREDGVAGCLQETHFLAGAASPDLHLKVGGEAWGCDAEWATSLEFDLGAIPAGSPVLAAVLVVRKTGYSDDSQGFAYLGAYAYEATGAAVAVARDDLTPETALDIVYPPAANVDLSFDVTAAVQAWVAAGKTRAGLLLAPVYPENGYEDWISIGGCGYAAPPRLVVDWEGAVAAEATTWSALKAAWR